MEYNFCPECGTQNESDYVYCKNCGTQLKETKQQKKDSYNPNFHYNDTQYNNQTYNSPFGEGQENAPDNIEGIPLNDVAIYVGKNAHDICPKLHKLEITKGKASWCWPVAILGYCLGPIGSAIWFLYRKMYAVAAVFIAAGILLAMVNTALTLEYTTQISSWLLNYVESGGDVEDLEDIEDNLTYKYEEELEAATDLTDAITAVVSGLFAYYWYKKKIVKDIKRYAMTGVDTKYYHFGLASMGGTSTGMAALGVVIMMAMNFVAALAVLILSIL